MGYLGYQPLEMSPEPADFASTFLGFPLYSTSPDPLTLASRNWVAVTSTSAEPATLTLTDSAVRSKALTSPEPDTDTLSSRLVPLRPISPEPERATEIRSASRGNWTSPDPETRISKASEL